MWRSYKKGHSNRIVWAVVVAGGGGFALVNGNDKSHHRTRNGQLCARLLSTFLLGNSIHPSIVHWCITKSMLNDEDDRTWQSGPMISCWCLLPCLITPFILLAFTSLLLLLLLDWRNVQWPSLCVFYCCCVCVSPLAWIWRKENGTKQMEKKQKIIINFRQCLA